MGGLFKFLFWGGSPSWVMRWTLPNTASMRQNSIFK
jgi:hypothetical protein